MELVECVPNISEGRDKDKINTIADVIRHTRDVMLIHQDIGYDANRTVFTFAGTPEGVLYAAQKMIEKAISLIDMSRHHGEHPCIGAVDVCPFVPLQNSSMDQCIEMARSLGESMGNKMKVPIYLYEEAAATPQRKKLSNIRKGGFEGLSRKMMHHEWQPDFGPSYPHSTAGAIVTGARPILIAFNINLKTDDVQIAKKIAGKIRESGYIDKNNQEDPVRKSGMFKACKAIGWNMPGFDCVQVSTNLVDYRSTPPHLVYEACRKLALELGTDVSGSELIGMIPKEALQMAGEYYCDKKTSPVEKLIEAAVEGLGLNALSRFIPEERILEYKIQHLTMGEVK